MKNLSRVIVSTLMCIGMSCSDGSEEGISIFSHTYDFNDSQHGWEAGFTDYPAVADIQSDTIYEWKAEHTELPAYLGGQKAMMLSTNNVHGDLFMFLKKKLTGFQPNANYTLVFEVDLAFNVVAGNNVVLKAGASSLEPKKVIEGNFYTLTIDKGLPQYSGEDLIVLGALGSTSQAYEFDSTIKSNVNANSSLIVRTNSKGEIWLIVGTHSLYNGITTVYFKKINVVFSVSNQ